MRDLGKLYCHIPARKGSKRVRAKNLRYLCGKPLISYAIECAKHCNVFDNIFVNTDSDHIGAFAKESGVDVYQRDAWLASDEATGDDFTADFMKKMKPDTLVMISPMCPLVQTKDVLQAIENYRNSDCDTLITCDKTQMQVFCNEHGVNIDESVPLDPTQKNPVVKILNWAVTIWNSEVFLKSYRKNKSGYLGTKRILMPIDVSRTLKISHEEDFRMAELIIKATNLQDSNYQEPSYWQPGK